MFAKPSLVLSNHLTLVICASIVFVANVNAVPNALAATPISVEWTRQLGTTTTEGNVDVAVDTSGNAYITGYTYGNFDGETNAGNIDGFLTKYDASGTKQWTRLIGTFFADISGSIAVDISGNIFISGHTGYDLDGNTNAGASDAFVAKYDAAGTKLWTRLIGSSTWDTSYSVAVDSLGNAYISGSTAGDLDGNTNPTLGVNDAFLTKYDASGTKLWTRQIGTSSSDHSNSVTVDASGNIVITGRTQGGLDGNTNAGGYDAFVIKYDTSGNSIWTQQLGSIGDDESYSVAVDGVGNIYITGYTAGDFDGNTNNGGNDAFLTKYDASGTKLWTRQFGTLSDDNGSSITIDGFGNIFISGGTVGDLDGNNNAGEYDAFLAMYDASGNKLWSQLIGTSSTDTSGGVAVDSTGNVYISGITYGNLDGNINAGSSDAFLVKFSATSVPVPGSFPAGLALLGLIALRMRR